MWKYKFIYLFFLLLPSICAAQQVGEIIFVKTSTPAWHKPSPHGKFAFIITRDAQVKATGVNKYFIIKRGSLYSKVLLNQFVYKQKKYWLCQNIQIKPDRTAGGGLLKISTGTIFPDILYSLSIISLVILLAFWMKFYHHQFKEEMWVKYKHLWLLLLLLVFHYMWVGFFISKTAEWGHLPLDETVYFNDIKSFFINGFQNRFTVTIGISLYYLPFVYFADARSMYDIAPIISWLMVLLIAPAGIAFAFLFTRKITKSVWFAFAAIAGFMLLPKIYLSQEVYSFSEFSLFFTRPDDYGFVCYQQILTGFNSMRDTPSTCVMLMLMFLILKMRVGIWRYIIISALFGIACHLRINNVYFAPLIAYVFSHSDKKLLKDYPYCMKMLSYSLAAFFLVYLPQLLLNKYHNGGFFTFPNMFVNNGSSHAFEFHIIPVNIPYLFNIHYLYYGVFAGSCLLIKDSYKRNLLILWVVPMTIFFCAFRIFQGQPYRYLLTVLPGTIVSLAVAAEELRMRVNKPKHLYLLLFLLLFLVFPVLPIYGLKHDIYAGFLLAGAKHYIAPCVCVLIMLWYWKVKEWSCLWAAGIYSIIFLSSSAILLFSIIVLLLVWVFISWGREIFQQRKLNITTPSE
jgi:hypothetical protein